MGKSELMEEMQRRRLVAVIRSKSSTEALATVGAVADAGVKFVEITMTVPGAMDVIETLAGRSELFVGAGTVLSNDEAEKVISAGARFVVSPTLELDLIPICRKSDVVCVSGAASPTEILTAKRAGADLVKIFPADCLGGPGFIRQMLGPFPDTRFLVSGGVNPDNVKEYVTLGVTGLALASAPLDQELKQGGHDAVVAHVRKFMDRVEETGSLSAA